VITRLERVITRMCVISSLALAVSFVLPLTKHTAYIDADGAPVGMLGQLFPDSSMAGVVSHQYTWDDMVWAVPLIYFLPLVLVLLQRLRWRRLETLATFSAPIIAGLLMVPLFAMVSFSSFSLFPGSVERSYGGYVALGALICFFVSATILAVLAHRHRSGDQGINPDYS
jgi:hypothetical protein